MQVQTDLESGMGLNQIILPISLCYNPKQIALKGYVHMTALAGFLGTFQRSLSDLILPLTHAEAVTLAAGKYNIRDRCHETRIGVGFLLEDPKSVVLPTVQCAREAGWLLVKGVVPKDFSLSEWFSDTGLYNLTTKSGIAVVTSGNKHPAASAPLSRSGDFIGGAVGFISDYLDSVSPNRIDRKADGVSFLQKLSLNTVLQAQYSMHLALISLDGLTLRLIRSAEHSQRVKAKPYIYYASTGAEIVFGSFEENILQLGISSNACTLDECSFIDVKVRS